MEAVATQRLWLTEPARRTCIAEVVAVRGAAFALDRSLFAPTSRAYRHPQPHDQGWVWVRGEKRWLRRVFERDGVLLHELRGFVPAVGDGLNAHLDGDRRDAVARAHSAMHLLLDALRRLGAPPLVADPEVKLGGTFRLELAAPVAPALLAEARRRVLDGVAQNVLVEVGHHFRGGKAQSLDPQAFDPPDPYPGPDPFSFVRFPGICTHPCDGAHVERTGKVGGFVVAQARASRRGFTVIGKAG